MAYYSIFPEKDTTIYSHPDRLGMNTGNDEILELLKEKGSNNAIYYPSRILIQFKNEEIQSTISDKIGHSIFNNGTSEVALQLLSTEHKNLTTVLNLEAFALSSSWEEGTGRYSNLPSSSNGCTWVHRDGRAGTTSEWITGSLVAGSTGSIDS